MRVLLAALALLALAAACVEAHEFDGLEVGLIEERAREINCQKTSQIKQNAGRIKHPARRGKYGNNEELCWKIQPTKCDAAKSDLILSFTKLKIEEGYDFVQIADCKGKIITDDAEHKDYVLSDCCALVHFSSDYSVRDYGFTLKYGVVTADEDSASEETVVAIPDHKETARLSKTHMYTGDGPLVARQAGGFVFGVTGANVQTIHITRKSQTAILSNGKSSKGFSAKVQSTPDADKPDVWTITVGKDTKVGCYTIDLSIGDTKNDHELSVCVIFNPFMPGQVGYVKDKADLDEYVLQTRTILYLGSHDSHGGKIWDLAWEKRQNLVTYLDLLSSLSETDLGNIDMIMREASYQIGRVVHGRWQKTFPGGEKPGFWTSSHQILDKWRATNTGVKYGQCWVFSAMLVSMMRSMGLASRSVTNFDSAHERPPYDGKCVKKWKCNEDGDCESAGGDSVWNFHVWAETWAKSTWGNKRFDWNAHDATPQEHSEGRYQCGPCAMNLMKKRDFDWKKAGPKDCDFIKSEVDCDTYDHLHLHDGGVQKRPGNAWKVGRLTATKPKGPISDRYGSRDVDPWDRPQNLASKYKYETNTVRFREMISRKQPAKGPNGWTLKIQTSGDKRIKVGEDIKFALVASGSGKPIRALTSCDIVTYDNKIVLHKGIFKSMRDIQKAETVNYVVKRTDYQTRIGASLNLRCTVAVHSAMGKKAATDVDFWGRNLHFSLIPPTLKLSGREQTAMKKGQQLVVKFVYENPIDIPLTKLKFNAIASGSGVDNQMSRQKAKLDKNGKWTVTLKIKSSAPGEQFCVVSVSSDQIPAADGAFKFKVAPRAKPKQATQNKRKVRQKKRALKKKDRKSRRRARASSKQKKKNSPQKKRRQNRRKKNRQANRANNKKRRKQKRGRRKKTRKTRRKKNRKKKSTQKPVTP